MSRRYDDIPDPDKITRGPFTFQLEDGYIYVSFNPMPDNPDCTDRSLTKENIRKLKQFCTIALAERKDQETVSCCDQRLVFPDASDNFPIPDLNLTEVPAPATRVDKPTGETKPPVRDGLHEIAEQMRISNLLQLLVSRPSVFDFDRLTDALDNKRTRTALGLEEYKEETR
ncbi:hypothetical protein [Bifidobacterium sp. SO1]|uniref:hypothetical protein n=1 Tax=Bifidobacterium sp. SO1 TaxID=2809029 RepID=UPI001BDC7D14|nr:hypothetical protein [Bifidobacterium sp. SO1]MBT1162158.1 hypothetical protein [Bifidobacterium sp. SO1]